MVVANSLLASLRHRGPDDQGVLVFPADPARPAWTENAPADNAPFRLLLGHTRLSIIDLSAAGHQPMRSRDGRYSLVYNGEVYNYRELRGELEAAGVVFDTATDTEVVFQALIHWGKAALPRFTGMFSLALFDSHKNTLFCARDFFGIKPFFWHYGKNGFCFASEVPALLQFPATPRSVNPFAAYRYLCYGHYDTGGETMLQDVFSLPPAHCFELCLDSPAMPEPEAYWQPDINTEAGLSFDEAACRLRELFLDSVRLHLRSDVPLGVALSGGIDSSAITCAVRYLEPDSDLHSFSFIAAGSDVSEEQWASLAAGHARAIRHTVIVSPQELQGDLDSLLAAQGEPFGSTSIYAQYRVFKLAKECGITVTLDGQGADELLAGYYGYPGPRVGSLLRKGNLIGATRFLRANHDWFGRPWSYLVKQSVRDFVPPGLLSLALRCAGTSPEPDWLDTARLRSSGVPLVPNDTRTSRFPSPHRVKQTLAYQLTWSGLPQLLRHGDRNAMAHSIESRVPFLTREIAEFCLSLPEEYLVDMNGCSKSVFRAAMRGIVPDAILDRRDKIGFATPEKQWLEVLSGWVETTLSGSDTVPFLRMEEARKEWLAIRRGSRAFDWRVWRWISYVRWVQLFQIGA